MTTVQNFGGASVFNARDLKSTEVAGGFIAPAAFQMLLSDSHCVLEGPRGSGKTTLLRMLTPESYAPWAVEEDADGIEFIGVFIPADVRWAKQLEARVDGLDPSIKKYFMEAAFSVATGLAIIEAIESCIRGSSQYGARFPKVFLEVHRNQEAEIVRALSGLWSMPSGVPSFSGLKALLRSRQHQIGFLVALTQSGRSWRSVLEENRFLASPWLDNLVGCLQAINEIIDRREQRWAILLDELEIVPSEILESIVQALRSTDPSIKFKLAISPTGTDLMFGGGSAAPSHENDYRPIPLWYEKRKDARAFAEKLFSRALSGGDSTNVDLRKTLGQSRLQSEDDEGSNEPYESAKRQRVESFVSLYEKDESFKRELDRKGVDPSNPPLSDESKIGTYVRKITPLVHLRDKELKSFKAGVAIRRGGRRSGEAYFGYPNLLDLAEGNPRWILTLADLLKASGATSASSVKSQGVQATVLNDYTNQFVSKLIVYPTGEGSTAHSWTLMKFVDALGEELAKSLYQRDFSADPALSFKLDGKALSQFGGYIRLCIDLGALVIVRGGAAPLSEAGGIPSLAGARVRISYRLAPRYQLPLRSTKERSISGALKGGDLLQGRLAEVQEAAVSHPNGPVVEAYPTVVERDVPEQWRLL